MCYRLWSLLSVTLILSDSEAFIWSELLSQQISKQKTKFDSFVLGISSAKMNIFIPQKHINIMNQCNSCKKRFPGHRYVIDHRSHGCSQKPDIIVTSAEKVSIKHRNDQITETVYIEYMITIPYQKWSCFGMHRLKPSTPFEITCFKYSKPKMSKFIIWLRSRLILGKWWHGRICSWPLIFLNQIVII